MTKQIPLTQGKVALVDDDMFGYLNQWRWYARKGRHTWYAQRNEGREPNRRIVIMHRLITGAPDDVDVDHKNGNGLDAPKR